MNIGIHILSLQPGVDNKNFEHIMLNDVFPVAANTPGTVNRGGVSSIVSQHLLRSDEGNRKYWWLVKDNETLSSRSTQEIIQSMYSEVQGKIDPLATLDSSIVFVLTHSFDRGERDSLGRTIGLPIIDGDF